MLKDGVVKIGEHSIDVTTFAEATLLNMDIGALESSRNGEHASYLLRDANLEGEPCALRFTVGFEFKAGRLETVTHYLLDALSEEWQGRQWEMAGLEEEARLHAEWLGRLLGSDMPVRDRSFDWGRVWVTLDPKGWNTGITIAPRGQSLEGS